jgi:GNAT superfamily N-acetyltransferase
VEQGSPERSWVRAIEENHVSFFSRFGRLRGGHLSSGEGVRRFSSGVRHPIFNGAVALEADVGEATVREVVDWFRARELPFLWWLLPSQQSTGLSRCLEDAGLARAFETPGMVLSPDRLGPAPPLPEGLRIEPVNDRVGYDHFGRVLNDGDFQAASPVAEAILPLLKPDPGDSRFRFFLGYHGGEPVATSMRFVSAGAVGIYGIATLPAARRRGFGAAMTLAAVEDGQRVAGSGVSVLTATPLGLPVYKRLGFTEVCRLEAFSVPGPASPA